MSKVVRSTIGLKKLFPVWGALTMFTTSLGAPIIELMGIHPHCLAERPPED